MKRQFSAFRRQRRFIFFNIILAILASKNKFIFQLQIENGKTIGGEKSKLVFPFFEKNVLFFFFIVAYRCY